MVADLTGPQVMRLGAVPDDRRARLDHLACHARVVVETEHDRAEDRAAQRRLLALDIIDAIRRASAVQIEREPVELAGGPQSGTELRREEVERLARDPASGAAPGGENRNRLHLEAGSGHRRVMSGDLADVPELLRNPWSFMDAEGLEISERHRERVEVAGFLRIRIRPRRIFPPPGSGRSC